MNEKQVNVLYRLIVQDKSAHYIRKREDGNGIQSYMNKSTTYIFKCLLYNLQLFIKNSHLLHYDIRIKNHTSHSLTRDEVK